MGIAIAVIATTVALFALIVFAGLVARRAEREQREASHARTSESHHEP
jgi:hypothetical protein